VSSEVIVDIKKNNKMLIFAYSEKLTLGLFTALTN